MVSSGCVGVIAWAMRAVCGWDSLDCCSRVIVYGCVGMDVGVTECGGMCDCVGVIAWMREGVCGWDSLDCCLKVCTCVSGKGEEGEGRVCVCGWVGVTVWMWV